MFKELILRDFRIFQDKTIVLGKYLTVLAGRNSTGKSTILGLLANSGEIKKIGGKHIPENSLELNLEKYFMVVKNLMYHHLIE